MSTITTIAIIHSSSSENDVNYAQSVNPWKLYIGVGGVAHPDSTLRLVIRARNEEARDRMVRASYAALAKSKGKSGDVANDKRVIQYPEKGKESTRNELLNQLKAESKIPTVNSIVSLTGGPFHADCSSFATVIACIGMQKFISGNPYYTATLENLAY